MKKIFTLLFATAMLSTAFAQYGQKGQRDNNRSNDVYASNNNKPVYDNHDKGYDNYDKGYDNHDKGYDKPDRDYFEGYVFKGKRYAD